MERDIPGDRVCCLYIAPNERMMREHAEAGGFPVTAVHEIRSRIDPATAAGVDIAPQIPQEENP